MKLYKIMSFVLICICMNTNALSNTFPTKKAAKEFVQSVMDKIYLEKTAEGFDLIKPYFMAPSSEIEVMKNHLIMQAPAIKQRFGKTLKVEFTKIEEVGDSLMLIMYIQKFERQLTRWLFYFYKPQNEWILNSFETDGNIHLMFETKKD